MKSISIIENDKLILILSEEFGFYLKLIIDNSVLKWNIEYCNDISFQNLGKLVRVDAI